MDKFRDFLNYSFELTDKIHIDVKTILFLLFILVLTNTILKITKKVFKKRLNDEDKDKKINFNMNNFNKSFHRVDHH